MALKEIKPIYLVCSVLPPSLPPPERIHVWQQNTFTHKSWRKKNCQQMLALPIWGGWGFLEWRHFLFVLISHSSKYKPAFIGCMKKALISRIKDGYSPIHVRINKIHNYAQPSLGLLRTMKDDIGKDPFPVGITSTRTTLGNIDNLCSFIFSSTVCKYIILER
jgi:hypothetical protein